MDPSGTPNSNPLSNLWSSPNLPPLSPPSATKMYGRGRAGSFGSSLLLQLDQTSDMNVCGPGTNAQLSMVFASSPNGQHSLSNPGFSFMDSLPAMPDREQKQQQQQLQQNTLQQMQQQQQQVPVQLQVHFHNYSDTSLNNPNTIRGIDAPPPYAEANPPINPLKDTFIPPEAIPLKPAKAETKKKTASKATKAKAKSTAPKKRKKASDKKTADGTKPKRKRTRKACARCHRTKHACDSNRPCARCLRHNVGHLCRDRDVNVVNANEKPVLLTHHPVDFKHRVLEVALVNRYDRVWSDHNSLASSEVSIWRPIPAKDFHPIGDFVQNGYEHPTRCCFAVRERPLDAATEAAAKAAREPLLLAKPLRFELMWIDKGTTCPEDLAIYKPVPPEGYVALGHVAVRSYTYVPPVDIIRCVHRSCVRAGKVVSAKPIWTTNGSGCEETNPVALCPVSGPNSANTFVARPQNQAYIRHVAKHTAISNPPTSPRLYPQNTPEALASPQTTPAANPEDEVFVLTELRLQAV